MDFDLLQRTLNDFSPILEYQQLEKGRQLHAAGKVCRKLYFVTSGLVRAYYYQEGRDVTAHFAAAGTAITAPDSFITGQASKYNIEVLAEADVMMLDKLALDAFLTENPHLERVARHFTEANYIDLMQRLEGLIFYSARERYEQLATRQPLVLELATLGHIATYLNITPETLSRVRGKRN